MYASSVGLSRRWFSASLTASKLLIGAGAAGRVSRRMTSADRQVPVVTGSLRPACCGAGVTGARAERSDGGGGGRRFVRSAAARWHGCRRPLRPPRRRPSTGKCDFSLRHILTSLHQGVFMCFHLSLSVC